MGGEISTVDTNTWRPDICKIKTGIYTGNGADNRDINIGVDLASKDNPFVIIATADVGKISHPAGRTEYAQGDLSFLFGDAVPTANYIQTFTNTGFQVGNDGIVNQDTIVYQYIAFWEEP